MRKRRERPLGREIGALFLGKGFLAFLQGVFEKTGVFTWYFDGEFVVECW